MADETKKRMFQLDMSWNEAGTILTVTAMDRRGETPIPVKELEPILFHMDKLTKKRKEAAAQSGIEKRIQDDTAVEIKGAVGTTLAEKALWAIKKRHVNALEMVAFLENGQDDWARERGAAPDENLPILIEAAKRFYKCSEQEAMAAFGEMTRAQRAQIVTDPRENELYSTVQAIIAEKAAPVQTGSLLKRFKQG